MKESECILASVRILSSFSTGKKKKSKLEMEKEELHYLLKDEQRIEKMSKSIKINKKQHSLFFPHYLPLN